MARMAFFSSALQAAAMSLPQATRSSSENWVSLISAFRSSTLPMRASLSASFKAADMRSKKGSTRSAMQGSAERMVYSSGSGFTLARNAACFSQNAAMASWPKVMAASMSSSEISSAPASTMEM